jgi:hypothetical protein
MKKGCLLALALAAILGIGSIAAVAYSIWNQYNPSYHGKRVYTWADQAIWDEDPAAREEAVEVLLEALPEMEGKHRIQLVMRFCHPHRHGQEKTELPKEVLPFLFEAMKIDEHDGGYAVIAMGGSPGPETVPFLAEAMRNEKDPVTRKRILSVFDLMGPKARDAAPIVREALRDDYVFVRMRAAETLPRITPEKE